MASSDRNFELFFEIYPGKGPYLLLVHGLLSSRVQWMLNLEALARFTRPVAIELWGHGRSPAPEDPEVYTPEGYVKAFETIRERLGIEQWLICGQSLGAGLTLRYALECPERIIAQVFTNTTSGLREIGDKDEAVKTSALAAEGILREGPSAIEKIPVHPAKALHLRDDVKEALLRDCSLLNVLGVANLIRYTLPEISVRELIARNSVPALLVCGRRESRFLPLRDFVQSHMPFLEIVDLEGGHAVNIDAAEEFNKALEKFFNRQV